MTGKGLSPKQRAERIQRIIVLVERDGLNYTQIAKRFGMHSHAVGLAYRKAKKRIRERNLKLIREKLGEGAEAMACLALKIKDAKAEEAGK